jgi:hypothetical protein
MVWASKDMGIDAQSKRECINGEEVNILTVKSDTSEKTYVFSGDFSDLISVFPFKSSDEKRREMIAIVLEEGRRFNLKTH